MNCCKLLINVNIQFTDWNEYTQDNIKHYIETWNLFKQQNVINGIKTIQYLPTADPPAIANTKQISLPSPAYFLLKTKKKKTNTIYFVTEFPTMQFTSGINYGEGFIYHFFVKCIFLNVLKDIFEIRV